MITFKEYLAEIAIKGKAAKGRDDEEDVKDIALAIYNDGDLEYDPATLGKLSLFAYGKTQDTDDIIIQFEEEDAVTLETNDEVDFVKNLEITNQTNYDKMIEYCIKEGIVK